MADAIEARHAVVVAADRLAVDDAGARAQPSQRLDDQGEAVGQVVARTAVEPHAVAVLARDDAEAVVLDLVQPRVAGGRLRALVGRQGAMKPSGRGIGPPIERGCGARQTMALGHLDWGRRRVADALLVEDEPALGRVGSVRIVRVGQRVAPMTSKVIIVVYRADRDRVRSSRWPCY